MMPDIHRLGEWVSEARERSIELIADLDDDQLSVPYIPTINPLLWEMCHLAYFQEFWVLRQGAGKKPSRPDVDDLFDSITIGHETRWRLPVPDREGAFDYVRTVKDRVLALTKTGDLSNQLRYYILYSIFHEDMHTEALTYARQTLGYPAPELSNLPDDPAQTDVSDNADGDVSIPGGTFMLGALQDSPFVFDNEKWAHEVEVKPFAISKMAVTERQFAEFVDDNGYERAELWSSEGWKWLQSVQVDSPLYWKRDSNGGWLRRHFDQWDPISEYRAIIHVSWYEAEAFCRWSGQRLPTEVEWEAAASAEPNGNNLSNGKRNQPWGNGIPNSSQANLDWRVMGPVDVRAHNEGDSPFGCRQMIGNVWEWTASSFKPFPGFVPDMYQDYSQTSFYTRKVLRGGCWATRSRLIRNTWRNFYPPARRDVFSGFRTCAINK